MCRFCEMNTNNNQYYDRILEKGLYTKMRMGYDDYENRIFICSCETEPIYYYPNFCPVCGRNLKGD